MTFNPLILRRYFVLGTQNVENESQFFDILTTALKYGITAFQYREKGDGALKGAEKYRVAERVRDLTRQYHVPLIIDDDIPLAHQIHADGVHFGQKDGNIIENVRACNGMFVGVSVTTQADFHRVKGVSGIDYIGVGPIFATKTKADANPPIGLEGLRHIKSISDWPIVAIGGISNQNIDDIYATGINGVAVISMISAADNVADAVINWQQNS